MSEQRLILLLKISIGIGLCLISLGIYFHMFSDYTNSNKFPPTQRELKGFEARH